MNEHELNAKIQDLQKEVARWKNRALEAADKACFYCEEYIERKPEVCQKCRMTRIKEESGK